ncbi:hypothetical protein LOTGIDRAFT_164036 [Lottia gigantea]|uniref:FHA domain-containing protein n=1 Tax=Lottia gigantea TaxID=225164 RepID=V4A1D2_LOTGI|nr:hypothetical protein LOTGIDRAFT_164036 [Lottia gigantea]ESO90457.1 hypothetical protein LOTGIDRAFT_164036 [Lottia gigantea]
MAASDNCRWQLRRLGPSASCANVCDLMRLKNGNTRFGRSLDNDFYLDSKTHKNFISRHHAEIRYVKVNGKPQFVLYDHGLNGTFINDVRMEKSCVLKEGDKITFGHTNGFKIDPGQYSKQPNSEFQFTFERLEEDSDESDSSSDDSGPESDTTQPTNEHFCSRNLYNSPEYDRSQCWQQGQQVNKNNLRKSESELDNKDFTKSEKVNPRSPRGKKGLEICANKDKLFKGDQRQNGTNNVKNEHLDPPVLKKQATLGYSDSGNDSSSGDSSDSESTAPSEKSEENSSSESEHELTIDISVKTKASPRQKRTASATSKTRNAQTSQKKTNAKRSPVKAKTKTKVARGRPSQKTTSKSKIAKDNSNNHNTISPSRRLLFNKKSTANGKNNSLKPDNLGDPYDFNSEEEIEASQNKNKKTTGKQTKTAGNTKRKKPQGNNKNKKAKTSTTDESEEYGEEIWYYEGETCASESCLKPSDSTVEWVQCDDCDQWYHTMCVGAIYAAVKDTQMEFHCGC